MTQSQGVWSVASAPLELGTYGYSYVVDGRAELDPLNADVIPNYQCLNSVVRAPGANAEPWERSDLPPLIQKGARSASNLCGSLSIDGYGNLLAVRCAFLALAPVELNRPESPP